MCNHRKFVFSDVCQFIPSDVIDNILHTILKQFKSYPDCKLSIGSVNGNVYNLFDFEHSFSKNTICV